MTNKCKVKNCDNKVLAKNYCSKHYSQMRNRGKIYDSTRNPNKIRYKKGNAYILLRNQLSEVIGKAIIDKEDVFKINKYNWHISKTK